jgi:hypothetical protein
MALVFIEGFDHLQTAAANAKGWNGLTLTTGRFGGQAAQSSGSTTRSKGIGATYTELYVGFAWQSSSPTSTGGEIQLRTGATLTFRIGTDATGHLVIKNSSSTVVATGTTVLLTNTWYYVEVHMLINGASGSCSARLNGVSEISNTTGNFGSSGVDTIVFTSGGGGPTMTYDDIYICDTTGSAPRNTFLGDVRVATIYPNADGAHAQWTPSSGPNHYDRVNESSGTFPDGDTTYVSDATVGDLDTYTFTSVDGGATVLGVQVNLYARKDDAATRQIAPVIRQSGTDNVGTTVTLSSTYAYYSQIYGQDPTATDWTATVVNGDEFGVKTIA